MSIRKKILLGLFIALVIILATAAGAITVTTFNIIDYIGVTTAPPNPTAGKGRVYYDSGAKALKCLNSDGTSCVTGGGGGGAPGGSAGDLQLNSGTATFTNAGGFAVGTTAKFGVSGNFTLVATTAVNISATSSTSGYFVQAGTGGLNFTSTGGAFAFEGSNGVFTADTADIDLTATLGNISLTATAGFADLTASNIDIFSTGPNTREGVSITDTVGDAAGITPGSVTQQRIVTAATDTIQAADRNNTVLYNSGSAVAVTFPQANSTGFKGGFNVRLSNQNAGTVTVTPTTSTINGNATLVINEGQDCWINPTTAGTDYYADCNEPQLVAGSNVSLTRGVHSVTIGLTGLSPAPATLTPTTNVFVTGYTQSTGAWNTGQVAGNSLNGAASTSAFQLTGTPFTGGSGTTTFPFLYISAGASAPTGFSTNGEMFSINVPSAVASGRAFSIFNNGGSGPTFSIAPGGSAVSSGSFTAAAGSAMVISTRSAFRSPANGVFAVGDNAGTNTIQIKDIGVPTCAVTGAGTTGTCTLGTGSQDSDFEIIITPGGSSLAALGTVTVTYNATSAFSGGHQADPVCILWNGTGTWSTRATVIGVTHSQTTPVLNWDNNAVTVTSGVTYQISCHAFGI